MVYETIRARAARPIPGGRREPAPEDPVRRLRSHVPNRSVAPQQRRPRRQAATLRAPRPAAGRREPGTGTESPTSRDRRPTSRLRAVSPPLSEGPMPPLLLRDGPPRLGEPTGTE